MVQDIEFYKMPVWYFGIFALSFNRQLQYRSAKLYLPAEMLNK